MKSFRSVLVAILFDTIALVFERFETLLMRNLKAFDRFISGSRMGVRCGPSYGSLEDGVTKGNPLAVSLPDTFQGLTKRKIAYLG